jgi:predicted GNAT family N-acyltransferase
MDMPVSRHSAGAALRISRAETPEELESIYQFRYGIYVEEMHRQEPYADHANKRIEDPLDAWGHNIAATKGGEVVAVVRMNFFRDGTAPLYEEMYRPRDVGGDHPQRTCMITRLMLHDAARHGRLAMQLFLWVHAFALDNRIDWLFIDCNDHLVEFFKKNCFVEYRGKVEHPNYGLVTPMRCEIRDRACASRTNPQYLENLAERGL